MGFFGGNPIPLLRFLPCQDLDVCSLQLFGVGDVYFADLDRGLRIFYEYNPFFVDCYSSRHFSGLVNAEAGTVVTVYPSGATVSRSV